MCTIYIIYIYIIKLYKYNKIIYIIYIYIYEHMEKHCVDHMHAVWI